MAIDLPAFHESKPSAKHIVELPYPLSDDLEKYVALYNDTYKAHVTPADLIREIIRLQLDRDQEFRTRKSSLNNSSGRRVRMKSDSNSEALSSTARTPLVAPEHPI